MRIANKMFPYPVINRESQYSTYNSSTFIMEVEEIDTEKKYILKDIKFSTNSKLLKELFDNGFVKVSLVIECSETIYRKEYNLDYKEGITIELDKGSFNGKVVYSMYAYTTKDLVLKSNEEFIEDYQGTDYDLEKYSIIAVNDGRTIYMEHEEAEENVVKSIFAIVPSSDLIDGTFMVELNNKKIIITLSEIDFNNYNEMYNIETYKELFFSILLIPSLTEAISECKRLAEDYDLDEIEESYKWFKSIRLAYERQMSNVLTEEDLKECSPVVLAQQLMGKPIEKSLKTVLSSSRSIGDEDE